MRLTAAALALTLIAPPAATAALVSSGSISGSAGDFVTVPLPMFVGPGRYHADIAFSAPGEFALRYQVIRTTNFFCDFDDGAGFVPCGGGDVPIGFDLFAGPGETAATLFYAIAAPFRENYSPTQFGLVFDHADGASLDYVFGADGAVSYRVVTAPVPEPASWALLIAGLALAAQALRRRSILAHA
jgi:hypothetical protein